MKFKFSNELKVGIICIAAIVAFVYGMSYLRGSKLIGNGLTLYSEFIHAGGLAKGAQVEINGLVVGKVVKANFNSTTKHIDIELHFDDPYNIPIDSKAIIYTNGLMGSPMLRIDFGKSTQYLQDEDRILGELEGGLMDKFGPLADKVKPIEEQIEILTRQINTIVHWVDSAGTKDLDVILSNANHVTENVERLTSRLESDIQDLTKSVNQVVVNVNDLASSANRVVLNIDGNKEEINSTISRLNYTLGNVKQVSDSLAYMSSDIRAAVEEAQRALENVTQITGSINSGEGSLGMLVKDKSLYNRIDSTVEDVNFLLDAIRKNPKKYLNVKVYVFERKKNSE